MTYLLSRSCVLISFGTKLRKWRILTLSAVVLIAEAIQELRTGVIVVVMGEAVAQEMVDSTVMIGVTVETDRINTVGETIENIRRAVAATIQIDLVALDMVILHIPTKKNLYQPMSRHPSLKILGKVWKDSTESGRKCSAWKSWTLSPLFPLLSHHSLSSMCHCHQQTLLHQVRHG